MRGTQRKRSPIRRNHMTPRQTNDEHLVAVICEQRLCGLKLHFSWATSVAAFSCQLHTVLPALLHPSSPSTTVPPTTQLLRPIAALLLNLHPATGLVLDLSQFPAPR